MLRFPDSGGVNGSAVWRRRWPPRSKGPTKVSAPDWTEEDTIRAEREIFAMCREAARRSAGGPQRARRRPRRPRDVEAQPAFPDKQDDFDGGTNTMPPQWRSMWPHFRQWNMNMAGLAQDAPKVASFPWDKKRKAERAAAAKAEAAAAAAAAKSGKAQSGGIAKAPAGGPKAAGGAIAKAPAGGPRATGGAIAKPPAGGPKPVVGAKGKLPQAAGVVPGRPESAAAAQPKKFDSAGKPAMEQAPKSVLVEPEAEKQATSQAEKAVTQDDVQERFDAAPYPVMSHYRMPMPGQFSYPYQLPITGQPIVMPGRPSSDFCHHCGRGSDSAMSKKGKKKDKPLDMDTFLADVERKLTGKLQMQEMFMQELEEHYRDTLASRSPPPCRRSHTDNEEESEEEGDGEQSCLTEVDPNLLHFHQHEKPREHRPHRHRHHSRQLPTQQHRHQHKNESRHQQQEDVVAKPGHSADHTPRCSRGETDRQHPNRHPQPCPKATRSERHSSQIHEDRAHENMRSSSQRASAKNKSPYEKFARRSHNKVASSDETPSSASYRRTSSFEDSDTSSMKKSSSYYRKSYRSHSKSSSARSSEDRGSKYRSQLEIVTSQLPFRERNALRKSLASLRARKEDKELERQLELLERELFAGEENVEWEQQLSLDTPSGRLKIDELEAKEDSVLDALFKEQDGFSEEDVMSEPERT